jgi:methyltransferase (TIGR00027 family)
MKQAQRSRTMELPAIMRALHQTLDDDPKILTDPISARLLGSEEDRNWFASVLEQSGGKRLRAAFALRARYAEDALAEGVQRGVKQYAVLGAGLDTFAYRQPEWGGSLKIYEVDHPITQQVKQDRLKAAGIAVPSNLRFVPIDFERASLGEALRRSDFDFGALTLCSWMGVTQYLTREALEATFRFVLGLTAASEIVFSIIVSEGAVTGEEGAALANAAQRAGEIGEPWLSRLDPDDLEAKLRAMGFSRVIQLTPEEAHRRYFENRRDGLRERRGERLIRAIV